MEFSTSKRTAFSLLPFGLERLRQPDFVQKSREAEYADPVPLLVEQVVEVHGVGDAAACPCACLAEEAALPVWISYDLLDDWARSGQVS